MCANHRTKIFWKWYKELLGDAIYYGSSPSGGQGRYWAVGFGGHDFD